MGFLDSLFMQHYTLILKSLVNGMRSMRAQLTILFGSLALLIGASGSLYINHVVSARMTDAKGESIQRLAQNIAISLTENLQERAREVSLLAQTPLLTSADLHSKELQENLTRTKRTYRHYAWVGVADTNGILQAASDNVLVGQSAAKRPWFIHGRDGDFFGDIHEAVLLAKYLQHEAAGEPLRFVDFASPVYDAHGKLRGVLATHAHWRWVSEAIQTHLPANAKVNGIEVFIVNLSGAVLSPYEAIGKLAIPPQLLASSLREQLGQPISQQKSQQLQWEGQGTFLVSSVLVKAADGSDLGWRVIVRQPVAKALINVSELHRQMLIVGAVMTAIVMLLTYWLSKTFSRPIQQLSRSAGRIAQGDEETSLTVDTNILEINHLMTSLSAMTSTLLARKHELLDINDQLEHKVEQRTAELQKSNEELALAAIKLEQLARQDALTGLGNRMASDEHLQTEYLRMKRSGTRYCVLLLDADHFKNVNDTYGHAMGDQVLQHIAAILKTSARESDFVARFGGEEFLILLPNTDLKGATIAAEKICKVIADSSAPHQQRITVSIGAALASPSDADKNDAVRRADQALYQAKQNGRNRVAFAPPLYSL